MIGAFIFLTIFVCFAVTFSIGLTITIFSFRKLSNRDHAGNTWLLWLSVTAGTLIVLFILAGSTADFGDSAQPSLQGYEAMTRTLIFLAMIPGAALAAGGAVNMIRVYRLPLKEEI